MLVAVNGFAAPTVCIKGPYSSTVPELQTATIETSGITLTLGFSEPVAKGSAYNDNQWTLTCSTTTGLSVAYNSGDDSAEWTMDISGGTVKTSDTDTCTLSFDGTANSVENFVEIDLDAVISLSVDNNSAQEESGDCTTAYAVFDTYSAGGTSLYNYITGDDLWGQSFTTDAVSRQLCSIQIRTNNESGSGNCTVYIDDDLDFDDDDSGNEAVVSSSVAVSNSHISFWDLSSLSKTLSSSTKYYIGLVCPTRPFAAVVSDGSDAGGEAYVTEDGADLNLTGHTYLSSDWRVIVNVQGSAP